MVTINKIEIENFLGQGNLTWNLDPEVNILGGKNGSGKSTILDAISFALYDQTDRMAQKRSEFASKGTLECMAELVFEVDGIEYCSHSTLKAVSRGINGGKYDDSVVNLPFIHKASDFTGIVFANSFTVADRLEGQTVYLEFRQVSGEAKIYCGDALLGEHRGASSCFRVKLTDAAAPGQRAAEKKGPFSEV